jgi:hypothetical protein
MLEMAPVIEAQTLKYQQITGYGLTSTSVMHTHPDIDYFIIYTPGTDQTSLQFYTTVDGSPIFFAFAQADYAELSTMQVRCMEYISTYDVWVVLGRNGDAAMLRISDLDSFPTVEVLWRGTIVGFEAVLPRNMIHGGFGSDLIFVTNGSSIYRLIITPTKPGSQSLDLTYDSVIAITGSRAITHFHRLDGQDIILAYGTDTSTTNKVVIINGYSVVVSGGINPTSSLFIGAWYDPNWDRICVMLSSGGWACFSRTTGAIQSLGGGTISISVSSPTACFYVKKSKKLFIASTGATRLIYQCSLASPAASSGTPTLTLEQSYATTATNLGLAPAIFLARLKQLVFSGGHLLKFK